MDRHQKTIAAMMRIYCRFHHHTDWELCSQCALLLEYAEQRLSRCPLQPDKPPCSQCPVHCYKPSMREQIRTVMRFAGPRMLFKHPILAILHVMDGMRKPSRTQGS